MKTRVKPPTGSVSVLYLNTVLRKANLKMFFLTLSKHARVPQMKIEDTVWMQRPGTA